MLKKSDLEQPRYSMRWVWNLVSRNMCDPETVEEQRQQILNHLKSIWLYIKGKKTDSQGKSPLKKNGLVFSQSKDKANILNSQFCSVFTNEDLGDLPDLPDSPYPDMQDIDISAIKGCWKAAKKSKW